MATYIITIYEIHAKASIILGIIGTGLTEDEATKSFAEEFDFAYQRFNSLDNLSLTNHNQLIKNILNGIVEKVE